MTWADDAGGPLSVDERAALIAAHERSVEALRNSAQYRVGELVIAGARSPRRLVRLPVDLWRLRKELLARFRVTPLATPSERPARDIVVATILDGRTQQALAPEWDDRPLAGPDPGGQLTALGPALLLVGSASSDGGALYGDVLDAAAAAGIPKVFWNDEDPLHFEGFIDAAAGFDWVFTVDPDCVDRYAKALGHRRIAPLPFAAQPRLHNPVGAVEPRLARACFARADPNEGVDVEWLLGPLREAGVLDAIDVGPSADLAQHARHYACFIAVDSATTSPTVCPRQVFELLACRTPVVSPPSPAIDDLLGDAVVTVENQAQARAAVERLVGDPEHRSRIGHLGYRTVMSRHTYAHRVDDILARVGIGLQRSAAPRVTVLAPTNRPEFLDRLLDNFTRQRDVDAELIVLTNSERFDRGDVDRRLASVPGARAIHLAAALTMGECLNVGLDATDARFVAKFDDDDLYGDHHLHDSLLVHRFVEAAIVGKKTFFAYLEGSDETVLRSPGNEFGAANRVSGSTLLIDRQLYGDVQFAALNLGEDGELCARAIERGLTVFSADRYNYVAVRRRDTTTHSWMIADNEYRIGSERVAKGLALDQTMI